MNTSGTKMDYVRTGRQWVEHAPPATMGPEGLSGWKGNISVCVSCASRIVGRGCDLKMLADTPVWDDIAFRCDLCGTDREEGATR